MSTLTASLGKNPGHVDEPRAKKDLINMLNHGCLVKVSTYLLFADKLEMRKGK